LPVLTIVEEAVKMTDARDTFLDAVRAGDADHIRALLAADPGLASVRDQAGLSPIMLATYRGHGAVVEALRTAGTPLDVFEAAAVDDADRLRELLDADPALARAWSPDGFTALHYSAFFGGLDGAELLLDAGADVDAVARNDFKVAPLHSAAAGRAKVALLLVRRGAIVTTRQQAGFTALHSAAQNGHVELVDALLAAGADPDGRNDEGVSAADLAANAGHAAIERTLRRAVAQPQ
jgi:ankyrin repeat protein